ncbi:hypothetical protein QQ045_010069 [Rhodiola kirilowii]
MDFFKIKKFGRVHKPNLEKESDDKPVPHPEEPRGNMNMDVLNKSDKVDTQNAEAEDDEDEDFISNEVRRRFNELRRNSFMVLIPEENGDEEEEDEEEEEHQTSFTEEREVDVANYQLFWCDFATFYRSYCERMLIFDRMSVQLLKEADSHVAVTMSPRSSHKKLPMPFRCLYLKKIKEPRDETEQLQQPVITPLQDMETVYVAQICLSWEALHCQYTQLKQKVSAQPESPTRYNHSAQDFQQFQVLLQRFIENEPYQDGSRIEQYARARVLMPKLLQVPSVQGSDNITQETDDGLVVLASDILKLIESSMLTYYSFIKMDKKKSNGVRKMFGGHNQVVTPLQQLHAALDKKKMKLKELAKKKKGVEHKSWPTSDYKADLLLAIIEVKLLARVVRMTKLTKDQLIWCEDKMKKLNLSEGKLQRDPSPLLFPC